MKLRISLVHLLLFLSSCCLAFQLAPYAHTNATRTNWRHNIAVNNIELIRWLTELEFDRDAACSLDDIDFKPLWEVIGGNVNPWGNPYRLTEKDKQINGFTTSIHVFSCGSDGTSHTHGDDLDDINSWSTDPTRFYRAQIMLDERKKTLFRALWLTPAIFCFLKIVMVILRIGNRQGPVERDRPVDR